MDTNKNIPKNSTQAAGYNPWNLLFSTRRRTESENSVSSNTSSTSSGKILMTSNIYYYFSIAFVAAGMYVVCFFSF